MQVSLPFAWSDVHRLHDANDGVWVGVRGAGDEVPERAERIREALTGAGARLVEAAPHDDACVAAVHDEGLLAFLSGAHADWERAGLPADPGQDNVVPYIFPTVGLVGGLEPSEPAATWARAGFFCFDTMTLIGPGTWRAARAAADTALTAADLVLDGAPLVYACSRPPGHHVTRVAYGGSCYLNNAAIAARRLRDGGAGRVAVVDLDVHHGNGTQDIFWYSAEVFTGSVHVDPLTGWFPHFVGTEHERGAGAGAGANVNITLPPGTGDDTWLRAVEELLRGARNHGAEALVVALGVDAAAEDRNGPLQMTEAGFRAAGRILGGCGLPLVVVQEGGYHLDTIGRHVLATLAGIEEGLEAAGV
jgi:acetoin utilization deacetylase AcuC-like enzyme